MLIKHKEVNRDAVTEPKQEATFVAQLKPALLRRQEVEEITKLCRAALYAKLNPKDSGYDPEFPVPIRVSASSVRWIEAEIMNWIATRPRTRIGGAA